MIERVKKATKVVDFKNTPPLRPGDCIEILPGNDVNWQFVGMHGKLMEYFADVNKWGLELETGEPVLCYAANLKRVPQRK